MRDTNDLVRSAERCAHKLGMPVVDDVPTLDSLEQVLLTLAASDKAWALRDGMQFQFIRRVFLRLMQPFVEREERRASLMKATIVLLTDEIEFLRIRISELETREDMPSDDRSGE